MLNRIAIDRQILHGKPRVRGTRIAVSHILELLADGVSPQEICRRWYPDLTVVDVRACIAFANQSLSGEEIHVTRDAGHASRTWALLPLTRDADFTDLNHYPLGRHHGIVYLRITPRTMEDVHRTLLTALRRTPTARLRGALLVVEPGAYRLRRPLK